MKVLIACYSFYRLTGSEIYVYELARKLKTMGCDVTVAAVDVGGLMQDLAIKEGVKIADISSALLKNHYDVIHVNQTNVSQRLCEMFPQVPKVCTIHSEIIALEAPYDHESIKKYISIRPSVTQHLQNKGWRMHDVVEIGNPIDRTRFKPSIAKDDGKILWVGRIDFLRKAAILHLAEISKDNGVELRIVGSFDESSVQWDVQRINPKTSITAMTFAVESEYNVCHQTAGIQMGRTTLEGWMCGKSCWNYQVDGLGTLEELNLEPPPPESVLAKYDALHVSQEILALYQTIL